MAPPFLPAETILGIMSFLPKNDLAASALTCRAWKDPALDYLWRDIDLIDLLQVLGDIRWEDDEAHFVRPLNHKDWERFRNLASRDREARFLSSRKNYEHGKLHASLIANLTIMTHPVSPPFLPHITHLTCITVFSEELLLFMGPKLQFFNLTSESDNPDDNSAWLTVLPQIPTCSPGITRLVIDIENTHYYPIASERRPRPGVALAQRGIAAFCQQLSGLRSFQGSLDLGNAGEVIAALAALPCLEELRVRFDGLKTSFESALALPTPFPSLRCLGLLTTHCYRIPRLLDGIHPHSQVKEMELGDWDGCSGAMSEMLAAAGRHPHLQVLSLQQNDFIIPLTLDILAPLYGCPALTDFHMQVQGASELTDDDIRTLVSHFPHLRHFSIEEEDSSILNRTLRSYADIAAACPMIESIRFTVDATVWIPPDSIGAASPTLVYINVLNSPIESAMAVGVAYYLSRLANPSSLAISASFWNEEAWDQVLERLE